MPRNGKSKLILRIFDDPQNYVPRSKIALNKTLRKFVIFSQITKGNQLQVPREHSLFKDLLGASIDKSPTSFLLPLC